MINIDFSRKLKCIQGCEGGPCEYFYQANLDARKSFEKVYSKVFSVENFAEYECFF